MIKILCDRCGRDIKEHGEDIGYIIMGINVNPMNGIAIMQDNELNTDSHYCHDCMTEIEGFIKNYKKSDKPVAEQKPKTEEPKTPLLREKDFKIVSRDVGKIMSLKNAGWSNVKIADEMGMTVNNVAQVIYQYRKKHGDGK